VNPAGGIARRWAIDFAAVFALKPGLLQRLTRTDVEIVLRVSGKGGILQAM
jgi:hypothetical protein